MNYQTHFAGGLAAGAALVSFTHAPPGAMLPALAVAGLAALLPDIDHGGSLPNKLLGIGGTVVSAVVSHRSATHSLMAVFALVFALGLLGVPQLYVLAAGAGALSHLVLDSLNPQGVPWLLMLNGRKFGLPLVVTGGPGENLLVRPVCYLVFAYFLARCFGLV